MGRNDIKTNKRIIREMIWKLLEEKDIARFPRPVYGRIPNFVGAEKAAEKTTQLHIWRNAQIVKINPDSPQRPLREMGLKQGKILIMATPRLRNGFIVLDPKHIPASLYRRASTIRGALALGRLVSIRELAKYKIDLMVTGSVAVDKKGHRLGKGEGYAEIEYGILREIGSISDETPILTTVHDIQIVEHIPRDPYDLIIDYIVTPTRVIHVANKEEQKPKGIYWDLLPCEKLSEINVLKELAAVKNPEKIAECGEKEY